MSEKVQAFAALTSGAELTPFFYDPPQLKADEVRVRVSHCGICGSDIQAMDDKYSVFDFPLVPGHEIAGYINEIGENVPSSRLGQRVGVGWQARSCGHCEWCLQGQPRLCLDVVNNGTWTPYGGFATSVVAQQTYVYLLPEKLLSEHAAVLMCAGLTVYSALVKHYSPSSSNLAILGIGGLGHLALQFAAAMGYQVTAISSSSAKKDQAISFGAHHFIDSSMTNAFKGLAGSFDLIMITSHGQVDWDRMLSLLRRKGRIILIAFPPVSLDPVDLVVHELSIHGSFVGNPDDMTAMLAFAEAHSIQPVIEKMPLSQVNEAVEKTRKNQARYRIVLENDLV